MKISDLRQSNKGFTLVEICVVLVIFSILASITTMSLITWQDYSINMQEQENAELVYMAARNKIATLKANGSFNEVLTRLQSNVSPEANGNYLLMCENTDYDSYIMSPKTETSYKFLFDLVTSFVYDKSKLKAAIAIELSQNGDINTVYYCDRCNAFDKYGNTHSGNRISINAVKDDETERYNMMVGMYKPE